MLITIKKTSRSRIEVRPTALLRYRAHTRWTLTYDFHRRAMVMTHTQKLKFKGQSVQTTEWKQTYGQVDRRTDRPQTLPITLPFQLTRSV